MAWHQSNSNTKKIHEQHKIKQCYSRLQWLRKLLTIGPMLRNETKVSRTHLHVSQETLNQVHPKFNLLQCNSSLFNYYYLFYIFFLFLFLLFDWTENANETLRFWNKAYINTEGSALQLQIWFHKKYITK